MPTDGDTTSGPSVTLDANGNCLIPYTNVEAGGTDNVVIDTASGQFILPFSQLISGVPQVGSSGVATVRINWARSVGVV